LFNSYKVTDKQSCNKINRIFTCYPDPEGTAEAEGGFKEEEEAEEAQAVDVVEVVEVGELKEEPRLELKIDHKEIRFSYQSALIYDRPTPLYHWGPP